MLPCPQGAVATKQCCYHVPQNRGKRRHWELLAEALSQQFSMSSLSPVLRYVIIIHCKLATLSPGKKPMLPSRRYFSLSPASRQRLQFYNEFIKWWPSANNFQCCPRAFGPRATLEIIGFGSPLDKASLFLRRWLSAATQIFPDKLVHFQGKYPKFP